METPNAFCWPPLSSPIELLRSAWPRLLLDSVVESERLTLILTKILMPRWLNTFMIGRRVGTGGSVVLIIAERDRKSQNLPESVSGSNSHDLGHFPPLKI